MQSKEIKGDLVKMAKDGHFDVIVHGQNCFHGWKAGIAKTIGEQFPQAMEADLTTQRGSKEKLGDYSFAEIELDNGKTLVVVNAYTQYNFGGGVNADYEAIKSVMKKVNKDFSGLSVGYPKIGAGHAGGDWSIISEIINKELTSVNKTLVLFE